MAVFTVTGSLPRPFRWLSGGSALGWATLAAAGLWLRARIRASRLSPVSSDWLLDHERQTRGRDF
jgi:hypothetical protein